MVTLHFGRNCFLNTTWRSHWKVTARSLSLSWATGRGHRVRKSLGVTAVLCSLEKLVKIPTPTFLLSGFFEFNWSHTKKWHGKKVLWPIVARAFLDICSLRGKSEKTGRRGASKVSLIPWNRRERARRISQGAQRVRQQLPAAYSKLDMNLTRFERGKTS